jgi:hypothetical protein
MGKMIGHWIPYLVEHKSLTGENAHKQMEAIIPTLKRWSVV